MIDVVVDARDMISALSRLGAKLSNPSDALEETGLYFERRIEEGFRKEIDPYGKKWAPLSPATITEKQRKGYPLAILTRTRRMRSQVSVVVSGKTLKISVPFPGELHQRGTRKMPKRQIIPEGVLSKTDERVVVDILIKHLSL
jgi:hypothetical protein